MSRRRGSLGLSALATVMLACLAAAGCATGTGAGDEAWSRSYAASFDEVWNAAIRALEDADFQVFKEDREAGRLAAESGETVLELDVSQRGELVLVDIMAGGSGQRPASMGRNDTVVTTMLHEISRLLREGGH